MRRVDSLVIKPRSAQLVVDICSTNDSGGEMSVFVRLFALRAANQCMPRKFDWAPCHHLLKSSPSCPFCARALLPLTYSTSAKRSSQQTCPTEHPTFDTHCLPLPHTLRRAGRQLSIAVETRSAHQIMPCSQTNHHHHSHLRHHHRLLRHQAIAHYRSHATG